MRHETRDDYDRQIMNPRVKKLLIVTVVANLIVTATLLLMVLQINDRLGSKCETAESVVEVIFGDGCSKLTHEMTIEERLLQLERK